MNDPLAIIEALSKELRSKEEGQRDRLAKRLAETDYHYACGQAHAFKEAQGILRDLIQKQRNDDARSEAD